MQSRDDFARFFERATRCAPFPYQRRLAEPEDFPQLLQVPTGTGKTAAAVIAWLWRRQTRRSATPRRLVYCLPMRVLVEQTRAFAALWLHRLQLLAGQADLDATGERVLRYEPAWGELGKVPIATVMGGETDEQWREYPESDLIIVGTQDMLVSRALNRGYAAWPQEWPVEFGLLNVDALWVMDEVQLMGPSRTTSVQLQLFAEETLAREDAKPLPTRRTLWMSATLGAVTGSTDPPTWMKTPEWGTRELLPAVEGAREEGSEKDNDLAHPEFADRWRAPKQLELHTEARAEVSLAPSRSRRRTKTAKQKTSSDNNTWTFESADLVERITKEAALEPGRTALVFLNTVNRARQLFESLETSTSERLLLHARFRPRDRRTTERRLLEASPPNGRIVVSTQVLEAGVDLDAQALFTDICPWPSLVQRLGRLNRRGKQKEPAAVAVVLDVPRPQQKDNESGPDYVERARKESSRPYEADDIDVTRERLTNIVANGGSLSPEALANIRAPLEVAGPVLRRFDLDDLFDTDPDLAGGHTDVSPFVRALDRDIDAYVLWRRLALPPDDQPPMHPDELCAVPFFEAQAAFGGHEIWILTLATGKRHGSAWRRARSDEVRPGDTLMIDIRAGCYAEDRGWLGKGYAEQPKAWVDRWDRSDGTSWRAWARARDGGEQTFVDADIIDTRIDARRGCGEEQRSFTKRWMELDDHSTQAEDHAERIVTALGLVPTLAGAARTAARWHDVGKALERSSQDQTIQPFQEMLRRGGHLEGSDPKTGVLYAKSNGRGGGTSGFRHEVASALAYLGKSDADDLVAYLILAHMGKVRLLPTSWDDDDPVDANGVYPGDWVPATVMPNAVAPAPLDPALFLSSRSHPGWQGRVAGLLERLGPFGLAYLEALVRVADWRAS